MKLLHLKSHSFLFNILLIALLITLALTSCGPDGLTDPVVPDPTPQINTSAGVLLTDVSFEFGLHITKDKSDCPKDIIQYDVQHEVDDWSSRARGCFGPLTQKGDPDQGWNPEYGRFLTGVEFMVDPKETQFTGTIDMVFPPDDDKLVFRISNPYQVQIAEDSTSTLMVDILEVDGTGVFANIDFVGKLYIVDARQILDREITDYNVTVRIVGTMAR
jgi:hypothetical protein